MTLHNEQDAINQAVEAGYSPRWVTQTHSEFWFGMSENKTLCISETLQDPAFWQALGKARGWKPSDDRKYPIAIFEKHFDGGVTTAFKPEIGEWQYHALRYFETRLSNGDMKAYWESLP